MNSVTITQNNNQITSQKTDNVVTVTQTPHQIEITEENVSLEITKSDNSVSIQQANTTLEFTEIKNQVTVASVGVQGPQGEQGIQGVQGVQGEPGADGADGADGVGVPIGGTTGQALTKASATDYDTQWTTVTTPPAGNDTEIQFNSSGALGADSNFTWDDAQKQFVVQAKAGQTANLTEWRDDTGAAHATVNADGEFTNTGGQANSEVFGANATVSGQNSTAIGNGATASISGTAIGTNASANGLQFATAIGYSASADAQNATAIGFDSSADFLHATAIGYLATCNGSNGVSIGRSATSSTAESTAIGSLSNAAAYSSCIGYNARSTGTSAVVVGRNAAGNNTETTAVGARSLATGIFATSLGARAGEGTNGARSTNIGYNTQTSQDSIALGYQASAVGNKLNIAIGNNCTVTSEEGIGIGHNITAGGLSVVIGAGASGSNAVGCRSTAATASSAFGFNARAVNRDATAIGYSSYAGRQCVSLGMNAYSLGSGEQPAMALGKNANVNNYLSSAVGPGCVATASYQFVGGGTGTYTKRTKVYFGNGVTNAAPESFTLYGTSATAGSNANGGNVAIQAGTGDGTGTAGLIILNNLPTSDPGVTGALWNDSGTLKVS